MSDSQATPYLSVVSRCVARALNLIKLSFNAQNILLDWSLGSDPCFPVPWRGISCDTTGIVTSLWVHFLILFLLLKYTFVFRFSFHFFCGTHFSKLACYHVYTILEIPNGKDICPSQVMVLKDVEIIREFTLICRDLSRSQLSGDVAGLFQDFTRLEYL